MEEMEGRLLTGFFGMASTNTAPPVRCLMVDMRDLTNSTTSFSAMRARGAGTTYARGLSSPVGLRTQEVLTWILPSVRKKKKHIRLDPDHGGVDDLRVFEEQGFDLCRRDRHAFDFDEFL